MKSLFLSLILAPTLSFADDIQALGDEFHTAASQPQWTRLNDAEGWDADQLELWDVNPSYAPGHMVMAPHSSGWFMDMRGVLVYKEVTGDFIVTMRMQITRRGASGALPTDPGFSALEGAPSRLFSLAGIFVRNPRSISSASPSPMPTGTPSWPAPVEGQPGYYSTDWSPDGDNYIFLSMGSAGSAGNWQYEVKTTRDGDSRLYYNNHGIPGDNAEAQFVTLQFIKIGNTVVTLRKHADGPWIVENRYSPSETGHHQQYPNFGDTLQVGITTYTDWNTINDHYFATNGHPTLPDHGEGDHATQYQHNYTLFDGPEAQPDLITYVDYYRFQRPDPALTEAALQALPITYASWPVGGSAAVELPETGAGAYLGDNANSPAPAGDADSDGDGVSNLMEIIMGSDPAVADSTTPSPLLTESNIEISIPHQNNLDDLTLEIEFSENMNSEDWVTCATRTASGWTVDPPHQVNESMESFDFTTPRSTAKGFYRLRATTP